MESLKNLVNKRFHHQLQSTWTASLLGKLGHKLTSKFFWLTSNSHSSLFKQTCKNHRCTYRHITYYNTDTDGVGWADFTLCTTDSELGSWHPPTAYVPQLPTGSPKLANFTAEIFVLVGHFKLTVEFFLYSSIELICKCSKSNEGWSSAICAHRLVTFLVEKRIFEGSPPFSSKITNTLPDGLNQDLGTWYLNDKHIR